jgi:hypothetical protein
MRSLEIQVHIRSFTTDIVPNKKLEDKKDEEVRSMSLTRMTRQKISTRRTKKLKAYLLTRTTREHASPRPPMNTLNNTISISSLGVLASQVDAGPWRGSYEGECITCDFLRKIQETGKNPLLYSGERFMCRPFCTDV